jgi:hypothetical protein
LCLGRGVARGDLFLLPPPPPPLDYDIREITMFNGTYSTFTLFIMNRQAVKGAFFLKCGAQKRAEGLGCT